ncbi:MAG: EamA/RhaT family transporter, partial [Anaerolineae bacterium]|nr:EamA/RhaT family transporter [Anaerolineae bacterium]
MSAAYVSLTILGEPIGSTILAVIFLSELPRQWQLVGSAIILCALLIASVE